MPRSIRTRATPSPASTATSTKAAAGSIAAPTTGSAPTPTPRLDGKDDEEVGLLPGLDPRVAYGKVKTAVGLGPNDQVAHKLFMEGEGYFQQKSYKKAAKKYEEATDRSIDMRLKEDAMFMAGESYFSTTATSRPATRTTRSPTSIPARGTSTS